jgi:hypothetical protein
MVIYRSFESAENFHELSLVGSSTIADKIPPSGGSFFQLYSEADTPRPPWDFIQPGRTLRENRREGYKPILASWLTECGANHKECTTPEPPRLPTRVLDVGGGAATDRVPLHVSSPGEVGTYVALSYCWGPSAPLKTTTANIEQHRQGIPFDDLPKTLQDAVTVTQGLGIRYLWIDALCIVQGDVTDWEVESSKMADVYSSAYVVIAASQAADCSQGFLDRRGGKKRAPEKQSTTDGIEVGQITNASSGSVSRICKRKLGSSSEFVYSYEHRHHSRIRQAPLNQRAWVLQENLLARRIVHFSDREMLWECVEGLRCECMEMDRNIVPKNMGLMRKYQYIGNETDWFFHKGTPQSLWRRILKYYTAMALSYESDRLPALSGLAKLWQSRYPGDSYLAGLWRNSILELITWTANLPNKTRPCSEYRAPSWSPFSLVSPRDSDGVLEQARCSFPISLKTTCALVLDARVTWAGADPTGAVKAGYLLLRSRVAEFETLVSLTEGNYHWYHFDFRVSWDVETGLQRDAKMMFLLIGYEDEECRWPVCLVLQQHPESADTYKRLGVYNDRFYNSLADNILLEEKLAAGNEKDVKII